MLRRKDLALNLDCLRADPSLRSGYKSEVFPPGDAPPLGLGTPARARSGFAVRITKRERDPSALARPRDDKQHPFIPNWASPLRIKNGGFHPRLFFHNFPRIVALRPSAPCPCRFPSRAPSENHAHTGNMPRTANITSLWRSRASRRKRPAMSRCTAQRPGSGCTSSAVVQQFRSLMIHKPSKISCSFSRFLSRQGSECGIVVTFCLFTIDLQVDFLSTCPLEPSLEFQFHLFHPTSITFFVMSA